MLFGFIVCFKKISAAPRSQLPLDLPIGDCMQGEDVFNPDVNFR